MSRLYFEMMRVINSAINMVDKSLLANRPLPRSLIIGLLIGLQTGHPYGILSKWHGCIIALSQASYSSAETRLYPSIRAIAAPQLSA